MENKRYHSLIGFPAHYVRPVGIVNLIHTRHAISRSRVKGFELPDKVNLNHGKIIEISMRGQRLVQIVIRMHYSVTHDIVLVIAFDGPKRLLKTAWLNEKNDEHRTLNHAIYETV